MFQYLGFLPHIKLAGRKEYTKHKMLNRRDFLDYINQKLSTLQVYIGNNGAMGLYDSHIIAEDFVAELLNIIFDYHLENLNFTAQKNQVSIDLADSVNGVSFQVTSQTDRGKIEETINNFVSNGLYKRYPKLIFLILGKKKRYKPFSGHEGYFDFDHKKHILDFKDLFKQIRGLNLKKLEDLKEFLRAEIKPDTSPQTPTVLTRKDAEQRMRFARENDEIPDFREAQLVGVDLAGMNLAGADLSKANLNRADLEKANLEKATLSRANLCGANLYRTHLKGANLVRAEFEGTHLFKPTLTDADLSEVDLSKANVDLQGANLENAKLFETNLDGIDLNGTLLTRAEYSHETRWPENFDPQKAGAILRVSCGQYGIKIKRPQSGYVINKTGNVDINVIGVYKEKPSNHYLCIIVANKDRSRFWRFPERIIKAFNEDSEEWSVTVPFLNQSDVGYYEVWILAALVAKEDFAEGEYSSLPPGTIVCDEVLVRKRSDLQRELAKLAEPITYRSRIRLEHIETRHYLHSHSINYKHHGTSGQQQVTAHAGPDENDYWIVKGPDATPESYKTGHPVEHGDVIRLEHERTRKNLHSHSSHLSPVTGQQEVTAFGENGGGDFNDNWRVEVDGGGTWSTHKRVRLAHVETEYVLHSHKDKSDPENTMGQQEVTCYHIRDINDWWRAEVVR
ncbi:MAG: hypothetical protein DPW09_08060 [Anaerolineae bacterium]|nr:hypothetical protein [Anaerolineae bacterium]